MIEKFQNIEFNTQNVLKVEKNQDKNNIEKEIKRLRDRGSDISNEVRYSNNLLDTARKMNKGILENKLPNVYTKEIDRRLKNGQMVDIIFESRRAVLNNNDALLVNKIHILKNKLKLINDQQRIETINREIEILRDKRQGIKKRIKECLHEENEYENKEEKKEIGKYLDRLKKEKPDYFKSIIDLNNIIKKPMESECRLSIIMPARNEHANIQNTLELLIKQKNPDGTKIDPKEFEIIILINRPQTEKYWDRTLQKIDEFKRKHPQFRIYPIRKTFYFPIHENKPQVKMGKIFKTIADLSILRSVFRTHQNNKHLIMPTGADYIARGENYFSKIFKLFDENPGIDQIKARIDLPKAAYLKNPLLHIQQRATEYLLLLLSDPRYGVAANERKKINGESIYTSEIYAKADGYNPSLKIGEDLNLAEKIRNNGGKVKGSGLKIITSPRRKIHALEKLGHTLKAYAENNFFDVDTAIKSEDTVEMIKNLKQVNINELNNDLIAKLLEPFIEISLTKLKIMDNNLNNEQLMHKSAQIVSRIMKLIGVEGDIYVNMDNEFEIKIKDISKLKNNLIDYKNNKNIRKPVGELIGNQIV